jgi:hypothetical protein
MVPVSLVHQTAKAVLLWYALLVWLATSNLDPIHALPRVHCHVPLAQLPTPPSANLALPVIASPPLQTHATKSFLVTEHVRSVPWVML